MSRCMYCHRRIWPWQRQGFLTPVHQHRPLAHAMPKGATTVTDTPRPPEPLTDAETLRGLMLDAQRRYGRLSKVPLDYFDAVLDAARAAPQAAAGLREAGPLMTAYLEGTRQLEQEALLHLAMRRHEHSDGCDGCLNVQRQVHAALQAEPARAEEGAET